MKTLFLRIFVWFWLAMVVIAGLLVITSPFLTRSRPRLEGWQHRSTEMLQQRIESVARVLRDGDAAEVLRHRPRRGWGRHIELFLFDDQGREILRQKPGREARKLAQRVAESGRQEAARIGSLHLLAQPAEDRQGRQRVLVAAVHRPPRLDDLLEPRVLAPRLLALAVVVGGLSLWLAWYLTSPLTALRQATRRLTSGDLEARVGDPICRRRDEVGELARDFNAMAERVQGVIGSQQRLLRDVSHELRSPLARQAVALGLARKQVGDSAQQWLDRIEMEGERLEELIAQLLVLTRLETGTSDEKRRVVDLAVLLRQVVADAQLEAEAEGRDVRLQTCESLPMEGHAELLRSALENVVRNAVHYTAEGSEVEVVLTPGSGEGSPSVLIRVTDHGPGVPEQALDQLFEPFFRVSDARDRQAGGSGLGLAIAARAVRHHGGTITAENGTEGGLVVTIGLPLSPVNETGS